jgi:hypothetical protein
MIPTRVVFGDVGIGRVDLCGVGMPVHDPPLVWKSFRGHGGNPGVEFGPHPVLVTKAVRRIDVNDLTWLEPNKSGEG